jgi:hypothetical protein
MIFLTLFNLPICLFNRNPSLFPCGSIATVPSSDQSLPPNQSLPTNETVPNVQQDTANGKSTSGTSHTAQPPPSLLISSCLALDTLKGPAPLLEAYPKFKSSSPPTLLRSERRQAGKQEYVTSCSQLEEILQQALGLLASVPVPPATIISGLQEMHEQCRKRKQGESDHYLTAHSSLIV